jgi:DNA-binding transcriptional regulator YiaG
MHMQAENPVTAARSVLQMNQTEFAKALGVAQSTVSRWESGELEFGPLAKRAVAKLVEEERQKKLERAQ